MAIAAAQHGVIGCAGAGSHTARPAGSTADEGMPTTNAGQINADLVEFIKS